ncbi:hypothetical protein [Streptacidiphilus carbonis]|uniref:hypothetical protein n=1 Tax=Streptacidiphilus carbonis TaxID=105422 RepID=UPI00137795B2
MLLLTAGALLLPQRCCAQEALPGSATDAIADPVPVAGEVHRLPDRFKVIGAR